MEQEAESIFDSFFNPYFLWFTFVLAIISVFKWDTLLNYYDQLWDKWEQRKSDATHHKDLDEDWWAARISAFNASRDKMQGELEAMTKAGRLKKQEAQKKKLEEKIAKYGTEGGHTLGSSSAKSDYNPLSGDSGGRYKPTNRSKCSGGGCG